MAGTSSTDSLTAFSENKMSANSVSSVNKNIFTLRATPHGQVLLSDRFRQTLLTTSLEEVQAIIYDRVLEAGI